MKTIFLKLFGVKPAPATPTPPDADALAKAEARAAYEKEFLDRFACHCDDGTCQSCDAW